MNDPLDEAADSAEAAGERFKAAGEKISGVGKGLAVGVTAPLVALGGAATKAAIDFDESVRKIQAGLGVTRE
ncbi:hypothetical protein PJM49_29060, partial [Mycobacterium kansasii]